MKRRRVLVAALSLIPLMVACESDRDRVESQVSELSRELPLRPGESREARQRRLAQALAPALHRDFTLMAPWLGPDGDRDFALTSATEIERLFPLRTLELQDTEAELSASGQRASVRGRARVSDTAHGTLHGFDVAFDVDLLREGAGFRVTRLVLGEPGQELPEARP